MSELVFFNVWTTVSEAARQALLEAMRAEAPALAAKPGFRSLTVWIGGQGDLRVIVEGRWESLAAFEAAVAHDPAAQESRARLEHWGRAQPGMFVESLHVMAESQPKGDVR
jgi:heme-degrading monooxygenase HmoA